MYQVSPEPYLIAEDQNLKSAISRMNSHGFQLAVAGRRQLVGSVTDGDVRRALLRGETLESQVRAIANPEVVYARERELPLKAWQLAWLRRKMAPWPVFLPVCDQEMTVRTIILDVPRSPVAVKARPPAVRVLLMAGGLGRRMGKLVAKRPKPLLEVDGRAIITALIEQVHCQLQPGLIYLATWHESGQFLDYARRSPYNLHCLKETAPLGTAGALRLLPAEDKTPVLLINGDIRTQADLLAMLLFHQDTGSDLTVAMSRVRQEVPFGLISYDANGAITAIQEKPSQFWDICAGMYCVGAGVIELLPPHAAIDMPELVATALRAGRKVSVFPLFEDWMDIGTPEALSRARLQRRVQEN